MSELEEIKEGNGQLSIELDEQMLVEIRVMLEGKARRLCIQHADVVGRADLVELRGPSRRAGQIADAGAR